MRGIHPQMEDNKGIEKWRRWKIKDKAFSSILIPALNTGKSKTLRKESPKIRKTGPVNKMSTSDFYLLSHFSVIYYLYLLWLDKLEIKKNLDAIMTSEK